MGGLKSFTFEGWGVGGGGAWGGGGGIEVFSTGGGWEESLTHWPKIYSFLSHQEKSRSRLSPKFFLYPTKGLFLPLNNNFHVITQ